MKEVSIRIGWADRTTQSTPSQISETSKLQNDKLENRIIQQAANRELARRGQAGLQLRDRDLFLV
jgi:hypothetical protein